LDRYNDNEKTEKQTAKVTECKSEEKTKDIAKQADSSRRKSFCWQAYYRMIMAAIKRQEKMLKKPLSPAKAKLSAASKKKLRRPMDTQPIPTVCVS
jgi:hypothetical protein